jgi:hypothetical protein
MPQRGITVLTRNHFDMVQTLKKGYPSQEEKFEYLYHGDQQEVSRIKTVITEYFRTKVGKINKKRGVKTKQYHSERLFVGRVEILVKYPRSGKVYKARIKSKSGLAAIEPIEPNTAFWLVDKDLLDKFDVIDLNKIPHIRQIHNKRGKEILSDFR